jgi:5'-nucleotidase (lipoprotein e(P4) family)
MKYILFALTILAFSCRTSKVVVNTSPAASSYLIVDGKLFTCIYQQKSAEYRALCLQGYNIAALRMENYKPVSALPRAIITDIDETILDNSPYAVHQGLQGKDYQSASWYEWTARGEADTMPGAGALLHHAATLGIEVFYITNREVREREGTLRNLKRFDLPFADTNHLFLRQNTSSKETRRQAVMANHEVVLLMGDNMADFSSLFDKKTADQRNMNTDLIAAELGKKFIVFPNSNYGDWESSLFNYNYSLTPAQKDSIVRTTLKNYR